MFIFSDLIVQTIIEDGLEDLRNNLDSRIKTIYEQLKESYLTKEYGEKELERYKQWITDPKNKISITQSWKQVPSRIPCINIQTVSGPEDTSRAVINDYSGDITTYVGGDESAGIESRYEENSIPIRSSVQVSVHVDDPGGSTALRWLYASVLYFIVSRKDDLVERGLDTTTFNSADFNRLNEFIPANVYSRYLTFSFTNEFTFTKRTPVTILDNIDTFGNIGDSYLSPEDRSGGGITTESGVDPEQEQSSFYTVDEE